MEKKRSLIAPLLHWKCSEIVGSGVAANGGHGGCSCLQSAVVFSILRRNSRPKSAKMKASQSLIASFATLAFLHIYLLRLILSSLRLALPPNFLNLNFELNPSTDLNSVVFRFNCIEFICFNFNSNAVKLNWIIWSYFDSFNLYEFELNSF